ncbi:26S proteasome non-ATPase regulatory subunit 10 [Astathelohania contejeani]|uniref:26S proteasome non-ATPase regulatory subunit 10 n=1 Tax=Astathelohania contejeani TaxID=164912 RepID=A0ABQ7HWA7_9MICR|nr:26S proteasome non-ATPase regulatory subunit 10 [Thelohania contejeani]
MDENRYNLIKKRYNYLYNGKKYISIIKYGLLDDLKEFILNTPEFEIIEISSKYRDKKGRTALHWACIFGKYDIVDYLVNSGYDILGLDYCGNTPFWYAVFKRRKLVVNYLIDRLHINL